MGALGLSVVKDRFLDETTIDGGLPETSPPSSVLNMFTDVRTRLVETGTRNRLVHVNRANTRGNLLNCSPSAPMAQI